LVRLRRENRQLLMERDFLKKAAAFFAKEGSKWACPGLVDTGVMLPT